jgi:hypothetical protein
MTEQRPLPQALADLAEAVHALCDPTETVVLRDDLTTTEHTGASLLDQIAGVEHGGETGKSRGTPNRLPLDPAKLDVWLEIKGSAEDLHDRALMHSRLTPEQHIRRIADLASGWQDPQVVLWIVDHLIVWRKMILGVLDPARHLSIAAPCPNCEARMVWRMDPSSRERVQVAALSVESDTGCTCLQCGAHWTPQQYEHLALVIGCEPIGEAS